VIYGVAGTFISIFWWLFLLTLFLKIFDLNVY
jgi:hypothetical protein